MVQEIFKYYVLSVHLCLSYQVHAEKLVIEADDLVKALTDAISEHGITRLVMGAASGANDYTKYGQGIAKKKKKNYIQLD